MVNINMLELRLIVDNVKRFGGYREKTILDNLLVIELEDNNENHKVYVFRDNENSYFKYDFKTHKIVG